MEKQRATKVLQARGELQEKADPAHGPSSHSSAVLRGIPDQLLENNLPAHPRLRGQLPWDGDSPRLGTDPPGALGTSGVLGMAPGTGWVFPGGWGAGRGQGWDQGETDEKSQGKGSKKGPTPQPAPPPPIPRPPSPKSPSSACGEPILPPPPGQQRLGMQLSPQDPQNLVFQE